MNNRDIQNNNLLGGDDDLEEILKRNRFENKKVETPSNTGEENINLIDSEDGEDEENDIIVIGVDGDEDDSIRVIQEEEINIETNPRDNYEESVDSYRKEVKIEEDSESIYRNIDTSGHIDKSKIDKMDIKVPNFLEYSEEFTGIVDLESNGEHETDDDNGIGLREIFFEEPIDESTEKYEKIKDSLLNLNLDGTIDTDKEDLSGVDGMIQDIKSGEVSKYVNLDAVTGTRTALDSLNKLSELIPDMRNTGDISFDLELEERKSVPKNEKDIISLLNIMGRYTGERNAEPVYEDTDTVKIRELERRRDYLEKNNEMEALREQLELEKARNLALENKLNSPKEEPEDIVVLSETDGDFIEMIEEEEEITITDGESDIELIEPTIDIKDGAANIEEIRQKVTKQYETRLEDNPNITKGKPFMGSESETYSLEQKIEIKKEIDDNSII